MDTTRNRHQIPAGELEDFINRGGALSDNPEFLDDEEVKRCLSGSDPAEYELAYQLAQIGHAWPDMSAQDLLRAARSMSATLQFKLPDGRTVDLDGLSPISTILP